MKFNKNILITVVATVVLALAGLAAYLLYGEISKFTSAKEDLSLSVKKLQKFYGMDPFPSTENIKKKKENIKALDEWYSQLLVDLKRGELDIETPTPSVLLQRLDAAKKSLRIQAASNNIALPKDFHFGFARYATGNLPKLPHGPKLTEQFKVAEILCSSLFKEKGVQRLSAIKREEFEETDQKNMATTPYGRGRGRGQKVSAQRQRKSDLYAKLHFSLEFTAKESSVVQFLNRLARHGVFFVVTQVTMTSSATDVKDAKKAVNEITTAGTSIASLRHMLRMERRVSGKSFEEPVAVKLEIDVYRLKKVLDSREKESSL